LVRIGVGRDAAEIAFALPYGDMEPTGMRIWIEEAQDRDEPTPRTTDVISTEEPAPTRAQAEGLLPNNAAESAKRDSLEAWSGPHALFGPTRGPDEALRRLP
jgi:hypothetical protein